MPTEASWPRLRALLDRALESEKGISVRYDSWDTATVVRRNIYKIRDMQRAQSRKTYPDPENPGHGISAYDGLVIWLRSSISRRDMTVTFHNVDEILKWENIHEPVGKRMEDEDLFPGRCCTVRAGDTLVEYAPSFKEAWNIIRRDHPCDLIIESGYTLEGLKITTL